MISWNLVPGLMFCEPGNSSLLGACPPRAWELPWWGAQVQELVLFSYLILLTNSWSEVGVQSACCSIDRHLGLRKMAWVTNDIVTGKLEGKACSQESSWVFHIHWKLLLFQHGFYFLIQLVGFLRYASQLLMDLLREPYGTAHPDKCWVSVVDAIVPSLLSCSLAWLISYVFANLFCH